MASAYGFVSHDRTELEEAFKERIPPSSGRWRIYFSEDGYDIDELEYAKRIASWLFGIAVGRWEEFSEPRNLAKPNPLSVPRCQTEARNMQSPLNICVDDPGHKWDVSDRIRAALKDSKWQIKDSELNLLWQALGCDRGGAQSYFARQFFDDHKTRYSKSLRKAPIYWQLATPSASYSIWLYYHRLTKDTFFKVAEVAKDKLKHERLKLDQLRKEAGMEPTKLQRESIEDHAKWVADLSSFSEEVELVAPLWNPNLNDGVIINFAPLWRLVPQNKSWQMECRSCWDKLVKGDYDWCHLAMLPRLPRQAQAFDRRPHGPVRQDLPHAGLLGMHPRQKMSEVGQHDKVTMHTYSELEEVSGSVGNFKVKIRKKARMVNAPTLPPAAASAWKNALGKFVDNVFEVGMATRKAIYTPFPQAVPRIPVIDTANCTVALPAASARSSRRSVLRKPSTTRRRTRSSRSRWATSSSPPAGRRSTASGCRSTALGGQRLHQHGVRAALQCGRADERQDRAPRRQDRAKIRPFPNYRSSRPVRLLPLHLR